MLYSAPLFGSREKLATALFAKENCPVNVCVLCDTLVIIGESELAAFFLI